MLEFLGICFIGVAIVAAICFVGHVLIELDRGKNERAKLEDFIKRSNDWTKEQIDRIDEYLSHDDDDDDGERQSIKVAS